MSRKKLRELEAQRAERWAAAKRDALACFVSGRYDDGEKILRALDQDIQGGIAIEKCYLEHLRDLVATQASRERQLRVFERGVSWGSGNVPTPHTAEEAASNDWAVAESRARFVHVLGFDPA